MKLTRLIDTLLPLALLSLTSNAFAQAAYKCKDAQGKTGYSDVPCPSSDGGKIPTSERSSGASGGEFKPGQICIEQLKTLVIFKDPESVKILSQPRKTGADLIDWNGIRVEALQFSLVVDAKNSYGAYTGGDDYRCDTSLDGRRIFSIRKR